MQVAEQSSRRKELGQYFTPAAISSYMASLFQIHDSEISLLDAGAGDGALTVAFVKEFCARKRRPKRIAVTLYELDERVVPELKNNLQWCRAECSRCGIDFTAEVHNDDFIKAAIGLLQNDLFCTSSAKFNAVILNPPYRKINSESQTRRLLREVSIETVNLYTAFLALAAKLLRVGGEMVAICPRSFCNGPYFKPFRQTFLTNMKLRHVHVFESRAAAFARDDVLQENVILRAVRSSEPATSVTISVSEGDDSSNIISRNRTYSEVVSPSDPELFIHLATDEQDEYARNKIAQFKSVLPDLGLEVSTGRVVDFRAKQFLVADAASDTAPLIYPCHFNGGFIHWPRNGGRKPNAIRDIEKTQQLLIPSERYVLVKRFTSKEERKRIVACIYDPELIPADRVGFENHLNYFHERGRGLNKALARGLATFLNSTIVDRYFRQFNGHTQVNATDLRSLRYPTRPQLESLGRALPAIPPDQLELDSLLEAKLLK